VVKLLDDLSDLLRLTQRIIRGVTTPRHHLFHGLLSFGRLFRQAHVLSHQLPDQLLVGIPLLRHLRVHGRLARMLHTCNAQITRQPRDLAVCFAGHIL